jgi:hypothetical protein
VTQISKTSVFWLQRQEGRRNSAVFTTVGEREKAFVELGTDRPVRQKVVGKVRPRTGHEGSDGE